MVANTTGASTTVPVATELPAGTEMDKVFGAPATGTPDSFLEALGVMLLIVGCMLWGFMLWLLNRRAGALS